jgi:hypothetical protein
VVKADDPRKLRVLVTALETLAARVAPGVTDPERGRDPRKKAVK